MGQAASCSGTSTSDSRSDADLVPQADVASSEVLVQGRGAPSNNKGWKLRFIFVSRRQGWDFGVEWSAHPISNVLPNLSDEEVNTVEQLKGILSASRAVRNLTEEWLVEAGLSPASRGMPRISVKLHYLISRHMVGSAEMEIPIEEARGVPEASRKRRGGDSTGQKRKDRRRSPHKADRASRGKGSADASVEPPAPRPRLKSVRELCSAQAGVDGRDYHAIRMCNLPKQASDAPLDPDLRLLAHGTPVWQSEEASTTYIRGMLFSRLASDLYTLPSEVLMDGATKAMVLPSASGSSSMKQTVVGSRSESAIQERQLVDLRERLGDSEGQLRGARARVHQMETELLDLARSTEALREDLPKRAIEEYKESLGFKMGLVRMGRISLEYGYQLALTRLQARHPGVEIELDPFITLPEDADVTMTDEQPFDDSLLPPEE
ncbi:hypothetical protein B296_00022341 [Ensete ventricosum]|uniref:Uncharacterized protein n=1 Tax=Ensete ventricosum TaxID=4639 RepID=A0A426XMG3_ENSVE|nr:hypothetical protein B296_00022341 [Ensete ventricosum]